MKPSEIVFTAENCPLTEDLVKSAFDELEAYDRETFGGGEPPYPFWARKIVDRAQAQGMIWTNARAA